MATLYKKTDFLIKVKDNEIHFYRDVLCDNSPYFKAMLTQGMKENKDNEIDLDDEYDDIDTLIDVIHPRKPSKVTEENVFKLLKIAYKYQFTKVIEECLERLGLYHYHMKTADALIDEIIYLHECINTYAADEELCIKLKKIMNDPIDKLAHSTEYKFDENKLRELPEELFMRVFLRMYELKSETTKFQQKFIEGVHTVKNEHLKDGRLALSSYGQIVTKMKKHYTDFAYDW